jgi:hypothetical protein|tara:strand:+ start:4430 stop:4804 length:375 start_codon:yes stop_codon:yes gene_type:complete
MQSILSTKNTRLPIKLTKRNSSRFKAHASVNWKYVEAVNGRAAMYGTILGGANWGLTGLNVIEQTQYLPCAILGAGSTLIAIGTMTNAVGKLSEEDFEKFASINTGRFFMTCFSGLVIAAILGV